ncbi:MAG: hypothetical protein HYR55_14700 [Acidobacteria bacterium]|nr:hypothetical protein [Acidobacteriota bacterium]MBI3655901.1 hypothetical protein [Acidobacteriota bacterium]
MMINKNKTGTRFRERVAGVASVLLGFAFFTGAMARPAGPENDLDLIKAKGRVIAEGTNKDSSGPLAVKSYRVEKIDLTQPMDTEINGQIKRVDKAYRVTVNGGPFPYRALVSIMCVDGVSIPAVISSDLNSLVGVTFDESRLKNGATMAVGYGSADASCDASLDMYSILPEKIKLGESR